jgi:hypothetical protein
MLVWGFLGLALNGIPLSGCRSLTGGRPLTPDAGDRMPAVMNQVRRLPGATGS